MKVDRTDLAEIEEAEQLPADEWVTPQADLEVTERLQQHPSMPADLRMVEDIVEIVFLDDDPSTPLRHPDHLSRRALGRGNVLSK